MLSRKKPPLGKEPLWNWNNDSPTTAAKSDIKPTISSAGRAPAVLILDGSEKLCHIGFLTEKRNPTVSGLLNHRTDILIPTPQISGWHPHFDMSNYGASSRSRSSKGFPDMAGTLAPFSSINRETWNGMFI